MKKLLVICLSLLLITGCGSKESEKKNVSEDDEYVKIVDINNSKDYKLETNDFKLTDVKTSFEEKYMAITGVISNVSDKTRKFEILSVMYDSNKKEIRSNTISYDIKANQEMSFFINHYAENKYDEDIGKIGTIDLSKIKYFSFQIIEVEMES